MSKRTSEANKAITQAWENEANLVRQGKGTRNWTVQQQNDILTKGKAYDENGKAFEGHHMKSAEAYPQFQGEPGNIQFLSRAEHFEAHDGNFQNATNGYFNHETGETKEFGDQPFQPCEPIDLTNPASQEIDSTYDVTDDNVGGNDNTNDNGGNDNTNGNDMDM